MECLLQMAPTDIHSQALIPTLWTALAPLKLEFMKAVALQIHAQLLQILIQVQALLIVEELFLKL